MSPARTLPTEPERFSKPWWLDRLRTFFWVAVVTVLVWVYADMEFTDSEDFRARIRLTTGKSTEYVLLGPDQPVEINFVLQGNRRALEGIREDLNDRGLEIAYDVSPKFGPDDEVIPVEQILQESLALPERGVTFQSTSPNMIPLEIDRLIVVGPLVVQAEWRGAVLAAPPTVEPASVEVRVAESRWEEIVRKIPDEDRRVLRTRAVDLSREQTGELVAREVEIIPSLTGVPVQPQVERVRLTFRVEQQTDTKTLTVLVGVLEPATWTLEDVWQTYDLEWKTQFEWRKEIRVSGSRTDLQRLRPEDIHAYVTLREEDKQGSWWKGTVHVRLPEDLDVELVGPAPEVTYRLVPRQTPPESAP